MGELAYPIRNSNSGPIQSLVVSLQYHVRSFDSAGLNFREFPIKPFWEVTLTSNLFACFRGAARFTTLCLALFALCSGLLFSQERVGGIQRTVTDASGAAVPGAVVEVTGPSLPRGLSVTTD